MMFTRPKTTLPTADTALPGRATRPFSVPAKHAVLGTAMEGPIPDSFEVAVFGLGCFWGEEKMFWEIPGVWSTSVGYAGGVTPNPTYEEVCSGRTGHAEVVRVVYDPAKVSYSALLQVFWEAHDPTQGMRQGNDIGSSYRSILLTTSPQQQQVAEGSRAAYQVEMTKAGYGEITTSVVPLDTFYYAEDYHQQYLHKVPNGYCPIHATGVAFHS
ncbi:MAG: peptide-methionine (S)-S-oxide reductase MsrA [Nocardioidaceae bacterium]